jgi:galactose mutarotase-like enzyme
MPADPIQLTSGAATATITPLGAELTSWQVKGRELVWHRDPQHWARSAPILFPVVGASAGGAVKVDGKSYPMPQHGFARDSVFDVIERGDDHVLLRLTDNAQTRERYPFAFAFAVRYTLSKDGIAVGFEVTNTGATALPYQIGYHPAFPWPFAARRAGHDVLTFASDVKRPLLRPDANGLLKRKADAALSGARMELSAAMFAQGAFVFADAHSDKVVFTPASGGELTIATDGFPHVAVWSKPEAPFISIEQWTGLPDWDDFSGELSGRASVSLLQAGASGRHAIALRYAE